MKDDTDKTGRPNRKQKSQAVNMNAELRDLRRRCARQRAELERLKAIVTVASTSDVENVIIVKDTGKETDE